MSFQRFVYGVLGMTVAGWGVFFIYVARYPFRRRERWAWTCIFAGITLWFIPDTAISAYFGVYVNVALNVTIAAPGVCAAYCHRGDCLRNNVADSTGIRIAIGYSPTDMEQTR